LGFTPASCTDSVLTRYASRWGDIFPIKAHADGETNIPPVSITNEQIITMGDRSPKSVQKQASQKQSKNDGVNQKKNALIVAQQATKAKAAANKKR
jgi:hypothetical protein